MRSNGNGILDLDRDANRADQLMHDRVTHEGRSFGGSRVSNGNYKNEAPLSNHPLKCDSNLNSNQNLKIDEIHDSERSKENQSSNK